MTTTPGAAGAYRADDQRTVPPCSCYPDYSTPDAPSLDPNPECLRHRDEIADAEAHAVRLTLGEEPF